MTLCLKKEIISEYLPVLTAEKNLNEKNINELYSVLKNIGLNVITSKYIYANDGTFSISIQEKSRCTYGALYR